MLKRKWLVLAALFCAAPLAFAHCPELDQIKRVSGEYLWISKKPGWDGAFFLPFNGKGNSTQVTRFIGAQWIQVNNLTDGAGYVECDYKGNWDDEVIRFTQAGIHNTPKPTHPHWSCALNPNFPGVQCTCSMGPSQCPTS